MAEAAVQLDIGKQILSSLETAKPMPRELEAAA